MDPAGQVRVTTRSRTLLFLSYRNSLAREAKPLNGPASGLESAETEQQGLMSEERVDMTILPPRWVDTVEDIEETLRTISDRMSALDKLHRKHVLPGFDDRAAEERDIERITREITTLFHDTQAGIRKIQEQSAIEQSSGHAAEQEAVLSRNVQTSLATRVQDLSSQFRKKQSAYIQKLRGQEASVEATFSKSKGNEFVDDDMEMGFTTQQLSLIETQDASISQRENEINQIAKSISDLATVFKDLQTFVIDQGTLLDRIDYNVENMVVSVKEAVVQLDEGAKYQKRARKRQCILLLILVIIGLVIILIFKPKGRHVEPAPPAQPIPDTDRLPTYPSTPQLPEDDHFESGGDTMGRSRRRRLSRRQRQSQSQSLRLDIYGLVH